MLLHPIALLCVLGCATSACAQSAAAAPTKPAPASLYAIAVKDLRTTFGLDDHPDAIADRIEKVVAEWLGPLQVTTDAGLAEALGEVHRRMTAARKASEPKDLAKRLPKMTAEQRLEAVATMLATMMCERPGPLLERERLAATELRALRQPAAGAASGK